MKKRRKKPLKIADSKECSEKYKTNERTEFGFYSETSMKILFMAIFHEHLWWHIAQYKKIVKSKLYVLVGCVILYTGVPKVLGCMSSLVSTCLWS